MLEPCKSPSTGIVGSDGGGFDNTTKNSFILIRASNQNCSNGAAEDAVVVLGN